MKIIPILHNIRSSYNVGAILRTAEGFGVKEVIFSGYTPYPGQKSGTLPHISEKITRQIAITALGAEKLLKCTYLDNISEFLQAKITPEAPLIALENNIDNSKVIRLSDVKSALNGQKEAYLLLGEEVSGIDPALFPYVDVFAEIPMKGKKESFNVSVAAGIALYELTR